MFVPAVLQQNESAELESFLVFVFGDKPQNLARNYKTCQFSDDYCRPTFIVIKDGTNIIGAVAYSEEFFTVNVWGLSWVAVHPDYRRHGIGRQLIDYCGNQIQAIAEADFTVLLNAYPDISDLYRQTGFADLGIDHGGGLFMRKIIRL